MLLGDFFSLSYLKTENQTVRATFLLNSNHRIFEGHFPGFPVVPGVCMLQMIKETFEHAMKKQTLLKKADHLKFLSVINPLETTNVEAELNFNIRKDHLIELTASIYNENRIFFKFKGLLAENHPNAN
jgi:3-hydroxyacyl-[acyl-carrier-protein] dehydratase